MVSSSSISLTSSSMVDDYYQPDYPALSIHIDVQADYKWQATVQPTPAHASSTPGYAVQVFKSSSCMVRFLLSFDQQIIQDIAQ